MGELFSGTSRTLLPFAASYPLIQDNSQLADENTHVRNVSLCNESKKVQK
jgi:hypothetical protein